MPWLQYFNYCLLLTNVGCIPQREINTLVTIWDLGECVDVGSQCFMSIVEFYVNKIRSHARAETDLIFCLEVLESPRP